MVRSCWIGALVGVLACAVLGQAQTSQAERYITVREGGNPAQKCRVLKRWQDKEGNQLCQVQAVDSGEIMTILAPDQIPGVPPIRTSGSTVYRWGGQTTPPGGTPAPPPGATVVATPKSTSPSLWGRMFGSPQPRVSQAMVQSTSEDRARVKNSSAEPARGWRDPPKSAESRPSWGQVERWTPEDAEKASRLASARAEELQAPKPLPLQPSPVSSAVVQSDTSKPQTPDRPSMLSRWSQRKTVAQTDERGQPKESGTDFALFRQTVKRPVTGEPPTAGAKPTPLPVSQPLPPPAMVQTETAAPKTSRDEPEGLWAIMNRKDNPKTVVEGPQFPMGMGPVMAVGSPHLAPGMPVQTPAATASAPNAFTVVMEGVPAGTTPPGGAMAPMMLSSSGVPDGMGNAFTTAGTTRPIPADLTRSYYEANAFHENGMGGAEQRPVLPMRPVQPMRLAMMQPGMPMPMQRPMPMPMPMPMQMQMQMQARMVPGSTGQLVAQLRDSIMPSEREMAVEVLSRCDWRREPFVVGELVKAAKADPAPMVRAACVRALGRMKVNTMPVVTAVSALRVDGDIRVRQEVEQALAVMTAP